MKAPLVSIIVPVYNKEKYLYRCHASLIAQDYENLEIIYVDDGSTDSSDDICDAFAHCYANTHCIHKQNGGLGYARNSGIDESEGKYAVFVDPDDYIEIDLISALVRPAIEQNVEFTLAGFTRVLGRTQKSLPLPDIGIPIRGSKDVLEKVLCRMFGDYPGKNDYIEMSSCARLYDLELIKNVRLRFNSERDCLSEDIDFNSRYLQHVKSAMCTDSVGYFYCDNRDSLTTSYREDRFERQLQLHHSLSGLAKELELGDEALIRLDNTLVAMARYCIKLEVANPNEHHLSYSLERIETVINNGQLSIALSNLRGRPIPLKNLIVNELIRRKAKRLLYIAMDIKNRCGI